MRLSLDVERLLRHLVKAVAGLLWEDRNVALHIVRGTSICSRLMMMMIASSVERVLSSSVGKERVYFIS